MKKLLLISGLALATTVSAQFSTGTVSLGSTGMTVKIDTTPTLATITLTGSDNAYLGIGFGNAGEGMISGKDGFVYNSTASRDYTFVGVGSAPTADAAQDWTETSNVTASGIRTVVATRSLSGGAGDTAITNSAGTINIFFAKGPGPALSSGYHGGTNRGYATLTKTAFLATSDLLSESKKVVLYPNPAKETVSFKNADKIQSIDIYESTGRKVRSVKLEGDNINVADLKSGSYYLEMTLQDGSLSFEKLIKE